MRTTICILIALAACKSDRRPPAPPPPLPAPTPAAKPMPALETMPSTSGAPGSQNLAPLAGLATRMHDESSQRPHVKVTAEAVFDALTKRGIALASTKQVLAATAAASYCALGVTDDSVAIAICEYTSADAARAGKRLLDTRYAKLVPDAVRALNGNTLVTVANGAHVPARRDEVLATFRSL
jgi:hypothetical protein